MPELDILRPQFMIDINELTPDYYILHYMAFFRKYIADGNPSSDTLNYYKSTVDQFIQWCRLIKMHALSLTEYNLTYYREWLIHRGFRIDTIKIKLTVIRQFYSIAMKLKLIKENPMMEIRIRNKGEYEANSPLRYLTVKQLKHLYSVIPMTNIANFRDRVIIMLMSLEGLRTVEVFRMSVADINFELKTIYIKGKTKNDFIYPRDDTMQALKAYIEVRHTNKKSKDYIGMPVFTSTSNNNKHCRMNRRAIRLRVDKWLTVAGLKEKKASAHMLRHTCATLLYEQTKDLKIVSETLRHTDIKTTAKYAHIQNRLTHRYTDAIPIAD